MLFKKVYFWCGVLALFSMALIPPIYSLYQTFAPASSWLVVHEVRIPDFKSGEDPVIFVNREVKREFSGEWKVEIKPEGKPILGRCQGSGDNDYRPQSNPLNVKLFDWWMAIDICKIPPGKYRVETTWRIFPQGGYPEKQVRSLSNEFTVTE